MFNDENILSKLFMYIANKKTQPAFSFLFHSDKFLIKMTYPHIWLAFALTLMGLENLMKYLPCASPLPSHGINKKCYIESHSIVELLLHIVSS